MMTMEVEVDRFNGENTARTEMEVDRFSGEKFWTVAHCTTPQFTHAFMRASRIFVGIDAESPDALFSWLRHVWRMTLILFLKANQTKQLCS